MALVPRLIATFLGDRSAGIPRDRDDHSRQLLFKLLILLHDEHPGFKSLFKRHYSPTLLISRPAPPASNQEFWNAAVELSTDLQKEEARHARRGIDEDSPEPLGVKLESSDATLPDLRGDADESVSRRGQLVLRESSFVALVMGALLKGLADSSASVRRRSYAFWDHESLLPVGFSLLLLAYGTAGAICLLPFSTLDRGLLTCYAASCRLHF